MAVLGNVTAHAVDAGAVAFAFHLPQPTVTHTALVTTDHAVDAGNVSWAFALPQPTVTHTPAVGPLLALSDFDDTGLDVECAALLEASAPGTSGNNFYRDSTRGGSDTPIEGELGVGPGETLISRFRRASAPNLTLNDNNLPTALAFNTFFGTGGAGADLTLHLQTTSDGLVSFTVAGAFLSAGGNWLNVTLPTAARTLLNNLATGDRFIFALARAATVAVDHAVDAGSVSFAFALPQPTVTHTLAAVTTDHAVDVPVPWRGRSTYPNLRSRTRWRLARPANKLSNLKRRGTALVAGNHRRDLDRPLMLAYVGQIPGSCMKLS